MQMFSQIVESNGKTIRENNLEIAHEHSLGNLVETDVVIDYQGFESPKAIVNLKGTCVLLVVGHTRDCDGTPLYILSDIPVEYPVKDAMWSKEKLIYKTIAHLVQFSVPGDALRKTGMKKELYKSLREMLT